MADTQSQQTLGPNEWLVDEMYEQYRRRPDVGERELAGVLRRLPQRRRRRPPTPRRRRRRPAAPAASRRRRARSPRRRRRSRSPSRPPATAPAPKVEAAAAAAEAVEPEPLRGAAARIVANMEASLEVPTATSFREVPAKLLEVNRQVINGYLAAPAAARSASPTSSATRSCGPSPTTMPVMNSHVQRPTPTASPGRPQRARQPRHRRRRREVRRQPHAARAGHQGAPTRSTSAASAAPTRTSSARSAPTSSPPTTSPAPPSRSPTPAPSAPCSRCPGSCRARASSSASAASTTRPRYQGADPATLADLGVSKVVTLTSTYDHRIIQGAESGLFLKKVHELLLGGDGFYDDVFRSLGVPYEAVQWRRDVNPVDREQAMLEKQIAGRHAHPRHRVRGHLIADLDPLAWKEPEMHAELDPATYGLTIWDLDREFLTGGLGRHATAHAARRDPRTCCATPTAARSASSTCTSRSPRRSAGSRSRSRASTPSLDLDEQAPHPRPAQRGRGVREVPRHQVRRPEALRHRGRRVRHPDPRRRARGGRRRRPRRRRAWAWPTAAGSTCSPTSSARATTSSSRSSRASSTPSRPRARAT